MCNVPSHGRRFDLEDVYACDPLADSRINAEVSPLNRYIGLVGASVLLIKSLLSQHSLDLRLCVSILVVHLGHSGY